MWWNYSCRKRNEFSNIDRNGLQLTEKDKNDILWGLKQEFDILCLSFVTCKENIIELKEFIHNNKSGSDFELNIWAKIETAQGVKNIKEIIPYVDGIMIGRGDLSPEVGLYNVGKIQNDLLNIIEGSGKKCIIATYVLESLKHYTIPYVSEVNDISNCIHKKVSGFMLAGEVGIGKNSF